MRRVRDPCSTGLFCIVHLRTLRRHVIPFFALPIQIALQICLSLLFFSCLQATSYHLLIPDST